MPNAWTFNRPNMPNDITCIRLSRDSTMSCNLTTGNQKQLQSQRLSITIFSLNKEHVSLTRSCCLGALTWAPPRHASRCMRFAIQGNQYLSSSASTFPSSFKRLLFISQSSRICIFLRFAAFNHDRSCDKQSSVTSSSSFSPNAVPDINPRFALRFHPNCVEGNALITCTPYVHVTCETVWDSEAEVNGENRFRSSRPWDRRCRKADSRCSNISQVPWT